MPRSLSTQHLNTEEPSQYYYCQLAINPGAAQALSCGCFKRAVTKHGLKLIHQRGGPLPLQKAAPVGNLFGYRGPEWLQHQTAYNRNVRVCIDDVSHCNFVSAGYMSAIITRLVL